MQDGRGNSEVWRLAKINEEGEEDWVQSNESPIPTSQAVRRKFGDIGVADRYAGQKTYNWKDAPKEGFGGKYTRGGGQMLKNFRTAEDYLNETD